jgi:hypothetical protein
MSVDKDLLMFAAMANGELNRVDKLMVGKNSAEGSINKLDINSLVRGQRTIIQNSEAFQGYVPETLVQQMVPDTSSAATFNPDPVNVSITEMQQPVAQPAAVSLPISKVSAPELESLAEDIKTIKSTLLRIDSTFTKISGMMGKVFNFITQKETLNK